VSGPMVNKAASDVRTWLGTLREPALPGARPGTFTSLAETLVKKVV